MTIAAILAAIGGLAAWLGPLALAGGPVGVAVAWLGSAFAKGSGKALAIVAGLALFAVATVAVTVHWQHLKRDRVAYRALSAQVVSLQGRYDCGARPAHERDLPACLTAIEAENETAKAAEIARQRLLAAAEQARQDAADDALARWQAAEDAAIAEGSEAHDGPVPGVLLDSWARERKARGIK
jgi:hypothetical protein